MWFGKKGTTSLKTVWLIGLIWIGSSSDPGSVLAQGSASKKECPAAFVDEVLQIPLDETGIADWRFLNPRRPLPVVEIYTKGLKADEIIGWEIFSGDRKNEETCIREGLSRTAIEFVNETAGRTFAIELRFEIKVNKASQQRVARDLERELRPLREQVRSSDYNYRSEEIEELSFEDLANKAEDPAQGLAEIIQTMSVDQKAVLAKRLGKCKDSKVKEGVLECEAVASLVPGQPMRIDPLVVQLFPLEKRLEFKVRFFDSTETIANATGNLYVGLRARLPKNKKLSLDFGSEPESDISWKLEASAAYGQSPDTTQVTKAEEDGFSLENPYSGDRLRQWTGSGSLALSQNLGDRAEGDVTFQFKQGALGEEDDTRDVVVTKYNVQAFGINGLILRVGKDDFANPTSKLAINQSGEGAELSWRWIALTRIVERESEKGKANDADDDRSSWILQARNLPMIANGRADLYGVYGDEELPTAPYEYTTFGTELSFSGGAKAVDPSARDLENIRNGLSGTLAIYRSERNARLPAMMLADSGIDPGSGNSMAAGDGENDASSDDEVVQPERDGRGVSVLGELTFSKLDLDKKNLTVSSPWSVSLYAGFGTGDDPRTVNVDEGYLGENANFAPDSLFMKTFASKIDPGDGPAFAPGLSNKQYGSVAFTYNRWSLLAPIAKYLLRNKETATSKKTIARWHYYRFDEEVFGGHEAGSEANLTFQLEKPKGVTATLSIAYFFPGSALREVFEKSDPWSISSSIKISISN